MNEDEKWMRLALIEASIGESEGEVPVGAILINNNKLLAKAHNQPIIKHDPTAHAEIQVIRAAGQYLQNYRLPHSTLYVTLEPCTMCFGAIVHARIKRIVFAAYDLNTGVCGSCDNLNKTNYLNHKILIKGGVLEHESKKLLQLFFKKRR